MAAARVIAMTMGDDGAGHRAQRVDMEISRRAIKAGRGGAQERGKFPHGVFYEVARPDGKPAATFPGRRSL
jgi:hypothetical protein